MKTQTRPGQFHTMIESAWLLAKIIRWAFEFIDYFVTFGI